MAATTRFIARHEIQEMLGVDEAFLVELEREEIVTGDGQGKYRAESLERIRVCHTLHKELGVNYAGLEVALNLLETIAAERRQFREALDWVRGRLQNQRRKP